MKIWILDCDVDKYENLTWREKHDIDRILSFDGRTKIELVNSERELQKFKLKVC